MKYKPLSEKLRELLDEPGMSIARMSRDTTVSRPTISSILKGDEALVRTVAKIANAYDLIPFIFFRNEDDQIEGLGIEAYLEDKELGKYLGNIFSKYRESLPLDRKEFVERVEGLSYFCYCQYESGGVIPTISRLENVSNALGLTPVYLVKMSEIMPLLHIPEGPFKQVAEIFQRTLDGPTSCEEMQRALDLGKNLPDLYDQLTKKSNELSGDKSTS